MSLVSAHTWKQLLSLPVIVAALGYFVDIYDIQLFGIVRIDSLKSLGLTDPNQISTVGATIINFQMIGLLLGGIFWGILGDKKGRLSVLFGSIITYSIANIACGFLPKVTFMDQLEAYKWLRFIAGVGLAGELGAGITLVSEVLPKELRALGTSLVAGIGLSGAVVAKLTQSLTGSWTSAYIFGGLLGFGLLFLRIGVVESGMYKSLTVDKHIKRGDFLSFFTNKKRFTTYMKCIGIGIPTWFCIGILTYFSNEFAQAMGIKTEFDPGFAIMWAYIGISLGDFGSGFLSHYLHSRKKAILYMMLFAGMVTMYYLWVGTYDDSALYFLCFLLGLGTGYWAMFVTVGAEQFGTNLRATAATTIPNMVRGTVVIMNFLYLGLKTGHFNFFGWEWVIGEGIGVIMSGTILAILAFGIGIYSTVTIRETHNLDLNYYE